MGSRVLTVGRVYRYFNISYPTPYYVVVGIVDEYFTRIFPIVNL